MVDADSITSRLCAACGLCCNGALFYTVHLKPGDTARALSALGLKLKKKRGQHYLLQPCPAHRGSMCSIYDDRPTRCRLFKCRLLIQVEQGTLLESDAMEQIDEAKGRLARLNQLLQQLGNDKIKQPLFKRCESVLAEPPGTPDGMARQEAVKKAKNDLDDLLDRRFRPDSHVFKAGD